MRIVRLAALPLVALALVVLGATVPAPEPPARTPGEVAVDATSYACPAGDRLAQATGQVDAGESVEAEVLPDGEPVDDAVDAASWVTGAVDGAALLVRHRGRAAGPVGFVSGVAAGGDGEGLLVGACPGVFDAAWLTGLGSGGDHQSTLLLTNLADTPAVADVELWGPEGPVDGVDTTGLVVDPGATRAVRLADLAAGEPELAAQVVRRRGALAVTTTDARTGAAQGTELVDGVESPSRRLVVPGVVGGRRTLHVLNPGSSTARVSVEVLGADGPFAAEGLDDVKVAAESVRVIDLPGSLGSDPVTLRLTSSTPIVASARSQGDDDAAVAEARPPLTGPAVVPLELGTDAGAPGLVLSAPTGDAVARLEAYAADGRRLDAGEVEVAAETTARVDLGSTDVLATDGAAYVVVRVEDGSLVGAAGYAAGGRVASLALRPAPVTVRAPDVFPAPAP